MGIYTDRRKSTTTPDGYELLTHESGHIEYDFGWHMGPYWSKYLNEMRDNGRFMGVKCSECGMVYIPPRKACARCYKEMNEWVECGPEGILKGFTVVRFPYIDPNNGHLMKVPFTAVWINLDGSDTRMMHFCDELDEMKLEVGMRMKAIWAKKPRPTSIHAVDHFEIIKSAAIVEEVLPERLKGPIKMQLPTKKTAKRPGAKAAAAKKKAAAKKAAAKKKVVAKKK
ncbi:MAG TPA: zinc ribbon domain-containing protein [Candidatus Anoxymicrobiaceae bacterium]